MRMQDQCRYSSFCLDRMKEIRQMNAIAVTGALFDGVPPSDYLQQARDAGAMAIHLRYDECTALRWFSKSSVDAGSGEHGANGMGRNKRRVSSLVGYGGAAALRHPTTFVDASARGRRQGVIRNMEWKACATQDFGLYCTGTNYDHGTCDKRKKKRHVLPGPKR